MTKSNKEKGRKIKLVVVFMVIIATSFLGLAGAFQPAPPPAGENANTQSYETPSVATSTLPAANETTSSGQNINVKIK